MKCSNRLWIYRIFLSVALSLSLPHIDDWYICCFMSRLLWSFMVILDEKQKEKTTCDQGKVWWLIKIHWQVIEKKVYVWKESWIVWCIIKWQIRSLCMSIERCEMVNYEWGREEQVNNSEKTNLSKKEKNTRPHGLIIHLKIQNSLFSKVWNFTILKKLFFDGSAIEWNSIAMSDQCSSARNFFLRRYFSL